MMAMPRKTLALGLGLSGFFACAQFRLIIMLFGADYGRAVDAAMGVVLGRPHWRAFQARVLGPLLIYAASPLFPSFFAAHVCFSIVTLVVMGWLAWRIGWRLGGTLGAAMLALFVFETSFAFLLAPHWLYAWDYLDIIVFLVFVDFVVAGKSWPWFVVLLAVGIYSRETAAFIAVWMILEALSRWRLARGMAPLDLGMLIAGLVCLVLSVAIVEAITRALFIEEIGPKIFSDVKGEGGVVQAWRITTNVNLAVDALTRFQYNMPFVTLIFLGICTALAIALMRIDPPRYGALGLTYLAHEATTLVFGYLTETRVFVELIPLIVLGTLVLTRMDGRPAPAVTFEQSLP